MISEVVICLFSVISLLLCFILFYKKNDRKYFFVFIKKVGLYSLPIFFIFSMYFFAGKKYRNILNGISMVDQLNKSFNDAVRCGKTSYIFGNSRCYRGINPDLLGANYYNFAYDNETFIEQYYKLKYLEEHKIIPDTIILGVDYFEFSFVSEALKDTYKKYFPLDYVNYIDKQIDKYDSGISELNNYINSNLATLLGRSASQYFYFLYYHYALGEAIQFPYLKDNGQYIIEPVPSAKEGDFVKRDSTILTIQKESFENIVLLAKTHHIKLFLVMPPTRKIERDSYDIMYIKKMNDYFASLCLTRHIYYLNYFYDDEFVTSDFMDDTHLTPIAADRFSKKLRVDIDNLYDDVE